MPRIDALLTCKFKKLDEVCPECSSNVVFEEAGVTPDGSRLDILLLCCNCGHRVKIEIEAS